MAAPYTAAPATTPTPIPTDDGRTGAEESASEPIGAPSEFSSVPEGFSPSPLRGEPPFGDCPARTGMEGSIMPMSVFTDADG